MHVINIRLVVEDGVDADPLMQAIALGINDVTGTVELKSDGFGHLVPDMSTANTWLNYDPDVTHKIDRMLALGQ